MTDELTQTITFTGRELAALVDATREHLDAMREAEKDAGVALEHMAERRIYDKAVAAYDRYSKERYGDE